MSFTEAELTALKKAYAQGVRRVTYDGKTVEYDDEAALLRRIRRVEQDISIGNGARSKSRARFGTMRRF